MRQKSTSGIPNGISSMMFEENTKATAICTITNPYKNSKLSLNYNKPIEMPVKNDLRSVTNHGPRIGLKNKFVTVSVGRRQIENRPYRNVETFVETLKEPSVHKPGTASYHQKFNSQVVVMGESSKFLPTYENMETETNKLDQLEIKSARWAKNTHYHPT